MGLPFQELTSKSYDPVGICVYCGSTENLTNEHIIPRGLLSKGGDWYLPKASCLKCCSITTKFEGSVQQAMLGPLRYKLGLKTRNRGLKKKKSDKFVTLFNYPDGRIEPREISGDDFPSVCIGFKWRPPEFLLGLQASNIFEGSDVIKFNEAEMKKYAKSDQAIAIGRVFPGDFARMLAKIAHTYAIAEFGMESFEPMLKEIILGRDDRLPFLVGGDETVPTPDTEPCLHNIYRQDCAISGVHYILVAIRLFAFIGMPRYLVVVGKKTDQRPPAGAQIIRPV